MKILGVESSATSASAAIFCDGKLLSMQYTNTGLTHSQTLLPMVEGALESAGVGIDEIDCLCASVGPGSFTGVRIGVSTVKGLAFSNNIKCLAVSSLEAIAKPFSASDCYIVSLMDARCKQFYTATFSSENGMLKRVTEDEAVSVEKIKERLINYRDKEIIFAGDGAKLAFDMLSPDIPNAVLAPAGARYQNAASVCEVTYDRILKDGDKATVEASLLVPSYLRLSQAERELKLKKSKE